VKLKGTATGTGIVVKYKKKPGKNLTKHVAIKAGGKWQFKFKPLVKKTVLKFYAENSAGTHSKTQKVTVIDEDK
jgi:hypothetical protein